MFYPEELTEEVRIRNDIVRSFKLCKLERKGRRYFGLCPFHNENHLLSVLSLQNSFSIALVAIRAEALSNL